MKIRFKSSEYNGGDLVKTFNKNLETLKLSESKHSKFKEGVKGFIKEIHLNSVFVLHQKYDNKSLENQTLQIVQDKPIFLLQIILNGGLKFSLKDNKSIKYNLSENMYNLFYIPYSKYIFKYHNHKKHILNIYFTESFLENKMEDYFLKKSKKFQQEKKDNKLYSFFNKDLILNRELKHIINEFLNCSFNGITKQSYLESKLTELVLIALTANNSSTVNNELRKEERESLIRVDNYIETHLKEELNIEKLSMIAGFNTSKFKIIFKQVYGMPVFKYITSLRIEKAIQLILKHNYSISQASYEVGYKNPQHFTVAFKKKLGYLPSLLIKKKTRLT